MFWHTGKKEEVLEKLGSNPLGLAEAEVSARLRRHGPNELVKTAQKSLLMVFLGQFSDFMILVLLAAAAISGVIGDATDTTAIIVIVVLNAAIGFTQEYRAEKAMDLLRKMSAQTALSIRDGIPAVTPATQLVPGDIVILEAGMIVPADMRLIEAIRLKVDESPLTGESLPVEKHVMPLADEKLPVADRKNMAYKGTTVSYGRGSGVVTATGMATELGKIATLLQSAGESKSPLQKRLAAFGKKLSLAVLVICAAIFSVGVFRGEPPLLMLLTAISLAVAAIPEALPAVITISLALGAKKMIRQNALIRKLPAVETLGSVTYICSDKTGTLTQNKMSVEEIYAGGTLWRAAEVVPGVNPAFFIALALNNDANPDASGAVLGDPTEVALLQMASRAGFDKKLLERDLPRVAEIPFDGERKCMTTFHRPASAPPVENVAEGGVVSFTKGAVEVLLDRAADPATTAAMAQVNNRMAADGLRVLGIAMRNWDRLPDDMSAGQVETGLTILGLVGMLDPPREEAGEAIRLCRSAGIRPVMISGDHPLTAHNIAVRIGILEEGDDRVMTGRELEHVSREDLAKRVENIRIFARVAPEQKLKIIEALQERGQFVAMTGDGVNDAPALKRADIGVAMGIAGTDVAKEAADMILLDDNFATIVKSVREGRRIFDNIRKFIKYIMTGNSGEIWTIALAPLLGLPIPLLPIHILWINLVTDGLPGLALAAEPAERGVMERPPRHPTESIFAQGLAVHAIWVGLLMGGVSLFTQAWFIEAEQPHWQTMVFTVLCLNQMGHVLAIRSDRESLFRQGIFSNRPLAGAFLLTFVLQMATIYLPQLNPVFKTTPLSFGELAATLSLSAVVFFAVELEKAVRRRRAG